MAYKPSSAGTQAFLTTSNLGGTTLNGALSDSATTITVVSTADFASSGNIRIEDEIISYTGTTATTFTGCTRGTESSTAVAHSDTTPVGERYSSSILDMRGKTQIQTHVLSDVNGDFQVYFLADSGGTDRARTLNVPYSASNGFQLFSAPAFSPYVQYHFSPNTGVTQTDFYYEQKFLETGLTPQVLGVDSFIAPNMTSTLNRSVIVGRDKAGAFRNVPIDTEGHLKVNIQDPKTAFGDLRVAELTPEVEVTFPYSINGEIMASGNTHTGNVTQADSMAVLQTSTSTSGAATLETVRPLKYRAGLGALVRFTALFTSGVASSTQRVGVGDDNDGFFFGYNGADFGILRIQDGTETWITQANWNIDTLDGNDGTSNPSNMLMNHENINVFEIAYQWLGAGEIEFFVEDPADGQFAPVHRIQYANNNLLPSIYNATLPISAKVINSGNNTNLTVKSASMAGFVEGKSKVLGPFETYTATSTHSTETAFFHLRSKSTYLGKANRITAYLQQLSAGNDANVLSTFKVYKNATLAGVPTWNDVNGDDSIMEVDEVQTYSSGGTLLFSGVIGKDSGGIFVLKLDDRGIIVRPGDVITVTSTSANSGAQAASLTWQEDF